MTENRSKHSIYFAAKKRLSAAERAAQIGKVDFHYAHEFLSEQPRFRNHSPFYCGSMSAHHEYAHDVAMLSMAIMIDIGAAMVRDVKAIADPEVRAAMKAELLRDLRILRRPSYYARETARRRALAAERRKIRRRTTVNPCPTPEKLLAAWNARKESKEAMITLGGMLQDLECYVDNGLKIDQYGNICGRARGIRGWINENLPELAPKYKSLMRYKAMAIKLRQAAGIADPIPTAQLLEKPVNATVAVILSEGRGSFAALLAAIERRISPETVFRE